MTDKSQRDRAESLATELERLNAMANPGDGTDWLSACEDLGEFYAANTREIVAALRSLAAQPAAAGAVDESDLLAFGHLYHSMITEGIELEEGSIIRVKAEEEDILAAWHAEHPKRTASPSQPQRERELVSYMVDFVRDTIKQGEDVDGILRALEETSDEEFITAFNASQVKR